MVKFLSESHPPLHQDVASSGRSELPIYEQALVGKSGVR
jgi:hypothetical protein